MATLLEKTRQVNELFAKIICLTYKQNFRTTKMANDFRGYFRK